MAQPPPTSIFYISFYFSCCSFHPLRAHPLLFYGFEFLKISVLVFSSTTHFTTALGNQIHLWIIPVLSRPVHVKMSQKFMSKPQSSTPLSNICLLCPVVQLRLLNSELSFCLCKVVPFPVFPDTFVEDGPSVIFPHTSL